MAQSIDPDRSYRYSAYQIDFRREAHAHSVGSAGAGWADASGTLTYDLTVKPP